MNSPVPVLVVDSGAESAEWICDVLSGHGFAPRRAAAARVPGAAAELPVPAAVVIDLATRAADGGEVLGVVAALQRAGRASPTLALSALGHADERVRIRRAGVDAILTKPVGAGELVLRLRQLVARPGAGAGALLRCADLTMDPASGHVERAGRRLELTPRERAVLELLLHHRGEVVTRTLLLETVWDYRFDPNATLVDTHVSRLRRKIDEGFPRPLLHTRRRVGYKLSEHP